MDATATGGTGQGLSQTVQVGERNKHPIFFCKNQVTKRWVISIVSAYEDKDGTRYRSHCRGKLCSEQVTFKMSAPQALAGIEEVFKAAFLAMEPSSFKIVNQKTKKTFYHSRNSL